MASGLPRAIGRAHARALDRDASSAERDLAALVAVTDRAPVGLCLPFGPTTSSTSSVINSASTPSPTPTDSASSPSFAAPASSPSASCTRSGSASKRCSPTGSSAAWSTVLLSLADLVGRLSRSQRERTRREDRHLQSSTSYGTSFSAPLAETPNSAIAVT